MDFTLLQVGKEFSMFSKTKILNTTGCVFEKVPDGGFVLSVYLDNMTKEEEFLLRRGKITTRIIHEGFFLLTLIQFANTEMIFEISFDPTLYKDNRMNELLKSNMINLIGIESTTNIIKVLRMVNIPMGLYRRMITLWSMTKDIENYSKKYSNWVSELDKRYTVPKLWEMGIYTCRLGE